MPEDNLDIVPMIGAPKAVGSPLSGDEVAGMIGQDIPASMIQASQKAAMSSSTLLAQARAARNEAKKQFDEILSNEAEAIKSHGAFGVNSQLSVNLLNQIYGPEQTAIIQDKRNAYERFNAATAGWHENSKLTDYEDGIEKLNPIFAPANSPAFSTYVEMYDLARKRAKEMQDHADALAKSRGEDFMKEATVRLLPESVRPKGVMPLSVGDVVAQKDNLTHAEIKTFTDAILSPAEHTDPNVFAGLVLEKGKVPIGLYQRHLMDALAARQIKSTEFASLWKDAAAAKDETEQLIERNLDPGIVKGSATAVFRQAQSAALYEYHLWKNSTEGQEADEADRTLKGLNIIRRHQNVAYGDLPNAIGISRYIGVTDRDKIDWKAVGPGGTAWKALQADIDANRITGAEIVNETNNLQNWQSIFEREKNANAGLTEAERKAKQNQQQQQKGGRFQAPAPGASGGR
jgi:hypothetical protein